MPGRRLMTAGEQRRWQRRKTIRDDERAELLTLDVLCSKCNEPMPALRWLEAGYDECARCYEPGVFGVEIGSGRAEVTRDAYDVTDY
ncbi:MAG TPA: hypothetical protein VIH71_09940 [Solirubrobacteraceae bacterium]